MVGARQAGQVRHGDRGADRRVRRKELCAANDYEACGALGCRRDTQAAKLAASHGVDANCARLIREYERSP